MTTTISSALEKISKMLKEKGFDKQAKIVESVGFDMPRPMGKWTPSMMQQPSPSVPSQQLGSPGFKPGELITELDPKTGEEKYRLWGVKTPMTLEELQQATKRGDLPLKYFVEEYNEATDPRHKKFFKTMMELAEKARQEKTLHRLSSISKVLSDKGYETLGKRILAVCEKISKS